MWQMFASYRTQVSLEPLLTAAAGRRRHAAALYGVNAAAERTPGTAHVPQRSAVHPARPKSPGKSWGGCCFVILFQHPHKTTPISHPHGAHDQ